MRYDETGSTQAASSLNPPQCAERLGEGPVLRGASDATRTMMMAMHFGGPPTHALARGTSTGSYLSHARSSLLGLQRRYGNRHVQRVLALSKQGAVQRQDDAPGGGATPGLPSPLGQSVTCSVDPIKIAKALKGDKSAALDIVNCCESGLAPLPAGCTKSLVEGLRKLLGKKPEGTNRCPPGFHGAKSTTYQGQCCSDNATIESAHDCCPGNRASMIGFCCPEGQVAQGVGCVADPSAPTLMTPETPASEPGDYELPDQSNVAVA